MQSRVLSTAPSRINVYGALRGNSDVNLSDVMPGRIGVDLTGILGVGRMAGLTIKVLL